MVSTQKLKVEFPVLALGWFKVGHLQFNVYLDVIEIQHDELTYGGNYYSNES